MKLQVLNKSTIVSDEEAMIWTDACAAQLRDDVAPLHERLAPVVEFSPTGSVDPTAYQVFLFDTADAAGALGYHDVGPDGRPYGKVFAKTTKSNGANISSCLSHEMIELFLDPNCGIWALCNDGKIRAYEGCDAVEQDEYEKHVGDVAVPVSNFVLPAYFDQRPPAGAKFDFLGKLHGPAPAMTPGGYDIVASAGPESQEFARRVSLPDDYPEWRREGKTHPASRTARRFG